MMMAVRLCRRLGILQNPERDPIATRVAIVRDEFNTNYQATHYTIAPAFDMPLSRFKLLLNRLAQLILKEVV